MGNIQDRADAMTTLIAAQRAQKAALAAVMATVAENSITTQNITDINAAGAAYDAAIIAALSVVRSNE
tara:strand:+ start:336 stop:539 length:204 start_codon:yes stop_codon:yes gene_type:complete